MDELPDHPSGYFLRAAALESYMSDFSTFELEEEFYSLLDTTIHRGKALLDGGASDAEIQFFVGAAHFYKGFHRARKREYLGAMTELARAKPWLDRVVSADSSFSDVYLGLGVLGYLSTKVKGFLIPFGSEGYEEPIRMMRRATEGKYTGVIAEEALVLALAGASKWDEAERLAMGLIRSYPTNRLFYWGLIEVYRMKKDPEGIMSIGRLLLDQIESGQPEHLYNQSLVRFYLAEAYLELGELRECVRECDSSLSLLEGGTLKRDSELKEETANLKRKAARALAKKVDR